MNSGALGMESSVSASEVFSRMEYAERLRTQLPVAKERTAVLGNAAQEVFELPTSLKSDSKPEITPNDVREKHKGNIATVQKSHQANRQKIGGQGFNESGGENNNGAAELQNELANRNKQIIQEINKFNAGHNEQKQKMGAVVDDKARKMLMRGLDYLDKGLNGKGKK